MAPREGGDKQGFEGNCRWNQNLDILIKPCVTKLIRVGLIGIKMDLHRLAEQSELQKTCLL